jgi:hypothetical protein
LEPREGVEREELIGEGAGELSTRSLVRRPSVARGMGPERPSPGRRGYAEQHGSWREDSSWPLYGDEFVLGVRVLGKSIRDTGTRRDMVVLVSDGILEDYRRGCSASSATAKVAAGVRLLRMICDRAARRRRPSCSKAAGAGLLLLLFST